MPADRARDELPVVTPSADATPPSTPSTVVGVLLAAGTSSRYGDANKLLAPLDGEPLVRRAARALRDSGVDRVVVVLGHDADRVRDALTSLSVDLIENPDYERGQATSVAAGVRAARDAGADAAVFALGDMPFVAPASVDALLAVYATGEWTALAAAYEGRRGNPVLFDARHFDALADVDGDVGGKSILLDGERSALVETGDPGVRRDIDTREAYQEALADRE